MFIVVNPHAAGGRGLRRWRRVERALRARDLAFDAAVTQTPSECEQTVREAIAAGATCIVAAGGDGTVNTVANAVLSAAPPGEAPLLLGAIGLGSSNDFHKPLAGGSHVAGVPVRLHATSAQSIDVGRTTYSGPCGGTHTRYFVLNASVGLVAEANGFFNASDPLLRAIKPLTALAIPYAALRTLWRYKPVPVTLTIDDQLVHTGPLTNLSILRSVHVAGGMRYDTPIEPGSLAVAVLRACSKMAVVRTLVALHRGLFVGLPHAQWWQGKSMRLELEQPCHLELDGEVVTATAASITVVPNALAVCGRGLASNA